MTYLRKPDRYVRSPERAHDTIDAITGITVDPFYSPAGEPLYDEVANRHVSFGLSSPGIPYVHDLAIWEPQLETVLYMLNT